MNRQTFILLPVLALDNLLVLLGNFFYGIRAPYVTTDSYEGARLKLARAVGFGIWLLLWTLVLGWFLIFFTQS